MNGSLWGFSHADRRPRKKEFETLILGGCGQTCSRMPKYTVRLAKTWFRPNLWKILRLRVEFIVGLMCSRLSLFLYRGCTTRVLNSQCRLGHFKPIAECKSLSLLFYSHPNPSCVSFMWNISRNTLWIMLIFCVKVGTQK